MMQCWSASPDKRPTFTELSEFFGNILQESVKQVNSLIVMATERCLINNSNILVDGIGNHIQTGAILCSLCSSGNQKLQCDCVLVFASQ